MGKKNRNGKRAKGFLGSLAITLILALAGCGNTARPVASRPDIERIVANYSDLSASRAETATVARIVDGDTFELADGRKVRLIGVNTPEIHGKVQPYGKEADEFTRRELEGREVVLFPDVSDTDKYGRLLRYVFAVGDERMFNERLVAEGYAQVMTIQPNVAYADLFVRKQKEARDGRIGLWEDGENQASEEALPSPSFDPASSASACADPQIKGNVNAKGGKIYHVPGASAYERTKPEQWFCTEREAQEAGFRKAAR